MEYNTGPKNVKWMSDINRNQISKLTTIYNGWTKINHILSYRLKRRMLVILHSKVKFQRRVKFIKCDMVFYSHGFENIKSLALHYFQL